MENVIKFMNKYYLHTKVKKFAKVKAREKTVSLTVEKLNSLSNKEKKYLNELNKVGYNIQFSLI